MGDSDLAQAQGCLDRLANIKVPPRSESAAVEQTQGKIASSSCWPVPFGGAGFGFPHFADTGSVPWRLGGSGSGAILMASFSASAIKIKNFKLVFVIHADTNTVLPYAERRKMRDKFFSLIFFNDDFYVLIFQT